MRRTYCMNDAINMRSTWTYSSLTFQMNQSVETEHVVPDGDYGNCNQSFPKTDRSLLTYVAVLCHIVPSVLSTCILASLWVDFILQCQI